MAMKRLLLATVVLATTAACTAAPKPPFDLVGTLQPAQVLDMVEWLGSVQNLSDTVVVTAGLGVVPNPTTDFLDLGGEKTPIRTLVLWYVPIRPGSKTEVAYSVPDPRGAGALKAFLARVGLSPSPKNIYQGGIIRADITIKLDIRESCVHWSDVNNRFGNPIDFGIMTDGGGYVYTWLAGASGRWRTYVHSDFSSIGLCASQFYIWQRSEASDHS